MTGVAELTVLALCGLLIAATLLPLWRHDAWWVRAGDFPRPQIFVVGLLSAIAFAFFFSSWSAFDNSVLGLCGLCLAIQAGRVYPYTPLAPKQVLQSDSPPAGPVLSLLVANVLMDNREPGRLLDLIRRQSPDLVLTVETDDWWAEQLSVLESEYLFTVKRPLDNTYGMLLHSRLELVEPAIKCLVEPDLPSIHTRVLLAGRQPVQLHLLHPKPPSPAESLETTGRDAELLMVGREVGESSTPTVVAGDLNDVAWSFTTRLFQRLSGLLDPRQGRGLYSTFHARIPCLRWPLDHVFHSAHFRLVRLERLPAFGSDHFPVFVELALEPDAERIQEEPQPQAGDPETAAAKIEAGEPRDEP